MGTPQNFWVFYNISATAGASDFKIGIRLGFANAQNHTQRKSGRGFGLDKLPNTWGSPLIFLQQSRCPFSVSRSSCWYSVVLQRRTRNLCGVIVPLIGLSFNTRGHRHNVRWGLKQGRQPADMSALLQGLQQHRHINWPVVRVSNPACRSSLNSLQWVNVFD